MNTPRGKAVGIDLGTTYSAVAHLDDTGRPVTLVNAEGDLLTPSAVLFEGNNVVVGKEALKALAWKSFPYSQEEVERLQALFRGKDWTLLVRCLTVLEDQLSKALWSVNTSWEKTLFVRGQRDTLMRILTLPKEIETIKEKMKDARSGG